MRAWEARQSVNGRLRGRVVLAVVLASVPLAIWLTWSGAVGMVAPGPWAAVAIWAGTVCAMLAAINTLFLEEIRRLTVRMVDFGRARGLWDNSPTQHRLEPDTLEGTFDTVAEALIREENGLRAALDSKTQTLQELHHGIKNNLQLVSSLLSLQARHADEKVAQEVLRPLQDRVYALSIVNRHIYRIEGMDVVRSEALLGSVVGRLLQRKRHGGHVVRTEIADLPISSEQAAPLALVCSEMLSDVWAADAKSEIAVWFGRFDEADLVLRVSFVQAEDRTHTDVRLFDLAPVLAEQLNGALSATVDDGRVTRQLRFPAIDSDHEHTRRY